MMSRNKPLTSAAKTSGTLVTFQTTHQQRKLALIATIAATATATFIWWQWPSDASMTSRAPIKVLVKPPATPNSSGDAQTNTFVAIPETVVPTETPAQLLDRIRQRQGSNQLFADAKDIELARSQDALMSPAKRSEAISNLPYLTDRQRSDRRSFIRYDMRTLESRVEGDEFDLMVPGTNAPVRAVVEQVESVDGMLRWSGRLLGDQAGGRFSVTHAVQDGFAVGTIDTAQGAYAMQATKGWGWVADQGADFSLPPDGNDAAQPPQQTPVPR